MTSSPFDNNPRTPALKVFMMDLLAIVPYYTAYLSQALLKAGVDVRIGSITYYLDRACFSSRNLRLQPGCLDLAGKSSLPRITRRLLKLTEHALNLIALTLRFSLRPPGIIHIQYLPLLRWPLPLDLWFASFCQWRGSKLVLTVHDLLPHDTAERYKTTFQRLYRKMDALICHSDHVKARLEAEFGIPAHKIAVIPHGPFFYDLPTDATQDARLKYGIPPGNAIVLWQGIIFPYKGLDLLLQAWQQVERENTAAHLVVVGTGAPDLLAALRDQVRTLGLQRVTLDLRFTSTQELVSIYRAADVVVYPYRAITTSGALATGLSLGKAIVASDLPVFRELLIHGENALLAPPGDVHALARAILTLLNDSVLRHQFTDRVVAMNFGPQSWQTIATKTIEVYRSTLSHERMQMS